MATAHKGKRRLRDTLAGNVRRLRDEKGWSQEALGERADLTQVFISQVETSKAACSVDTIESLAAAFGVAASRLLAD